MAVSVTSISSRSGGKLTLRKAASARAAKSADWNSSAEAFTDTRTSLSGPMSLIARSSAKSVSRPMAPACSSAGMKSAGERRPLSGQVQRTRASTLPLKAPLGSISA